MSRSAEQRPRVLVCTVSAWNDQTGGDTFSSLFADYGVDSIASLYVRDELPNSHSCNKYFMISEAAVVRSALGARLRTGIAMNGTQPKPSNEQNKYVEETRSRYERHRRQRMWILLYARELLWRMGKWRSSELEEFLDEFRPQVVVFGMEGYVFFNRICRYVVAHSGARAIGYFYDDNFTYKQKPWSLGHRLYRFFQRRSLHKTAECCDAFFAISPKTKRECDHHFGIDSILLTKPGRAYGPDTVTVDSSRPLRMLYTGNLLIGRLHTIRALSLAVSSLNQAGVRIEFDVYTTTILSSRELRSLGDGVRVHAAVTQEEVRRLQQEAEVLVLAEALQGGERKTARLSFSTKLTDYLMSGRCILAIGDKDLASIEYLRTERAALCASSNRQMLECLELLLNEPATVAEYGRRAAECGQRAHSELQVRETLHNTIVRLLERPSESGGDE